MKVTLYGYWRSLAAYRVRVALSLKGIPFEEISINLASGEQFGEAYSSINPQHVVPLLKHDGHEIGQSLAILEYIEDIWPNPKLVPSMPIDKAEVRALAMIAIADTHPLIVPRVRNFLNKEWSLDESHQTKWAQHWFSKGNEAIENTLKKFGKSETYSFGNEPTITDIALVSHVIGAKLFGVDMNAAPILSGIFENCMKLDSFSNAHPLKQAGAPSQAS
jgi:maleylacetoacetate isomerase